MRHVSDKPRRGNQNTILCSVTFPKILPFMGYVKDGAGRQATDNIIIGGMCIACWTIKATDTTWNM